MKRRVVLALALAAAAGFAPTPRRASIPRRASTPRRAASAADDEAALPRRPTPGAAPEDVVAAQMNALRDGDVMRCFKFASPANKAVTGPWKRFASMLQGNPDYAPMVRCSRWAFVGAISPSEDRKVVRVRVFPAGGSSAPFAIPPLLEYNFVLSRQPDYAADDDRRAYANCWVTDSVVVADQAANT